MQHKSDDSDRGTARPRLVTKIALLIRRLDLGGAEKQFCRLATGLRRWDYRPLVIVLSRGGELEQELHEHDIQTYVLANNGLFHLKRLIQIVTIFRNFRPEIVHGFDWAGGIYGKLAGMITGVPILIGSMRGVEFVPPLRVLNIERLLRWKTDAVISNSLAGKRAWEKLTGYPGEKIAVVPNGFNFEEMERPPNSFRPLRQLVGLPENVPIVGCIGSIYKLKNPLMFVDVAEILVKRGLCAHFVWIGDGPMRHEVECAIGRRGLGEWVHVLGKRRDAPWLVRDFQIGVLTSVTEGLPNVLMEYMFWSIPVVTTNVGGCVELVEHRRTGLVVEKDDTTAMVSSIEWLLQNQSVCKEMGERGRQKLENEFSIEHMLAKTVAVYEAVRMKKGLIGQIDHLERHSSIFER